MDNLEELIDIFSRTTDKKDMRALFGELFTSAELKDIAKRWYLMKEIYRGTPQRAIAKEMEISLCKITRGSKVLKQDDSRFRAILSDMFDETHL
ncbi:MAG: trp operon repressor [Sphaerochaetaceae bacterium]|nr:trp operon repressor [Sphaerochaetaceae bacterium]